LDLKDFQSKEKLDRVLRKTLNKISEVFPDAQPTVLWTGGGYHVYQPIRGFILEEIDRFACLVDPSKKDLTSRFMQFAEEHITDRKSDPQHRPSAKSCLIRIPGTINSKYNQEVRIVQKWNGISAPIQYLLRDFRTWLVSERINDRLQDEKFRKYSKSRSIGHSRTNTIPWIEELLQTPIADHRKYALWRIVIPYLFNVKKLSNVEVISIAQTWLDKCARVRALDFSSKYLLRHNIRNRSKNRYLPIGYHNLMADNYDFYVVLAHHQI
jgi:hypothetical protein